MAQLKPGLPGVDAGFVSNQTEDGITLRLDGSARVRHLRPHRLHGQGGIDSDEHALRVAREVQVVW